MADDVKEEVVVEEKQTKKKSDPIPVDYENPPEAIVARAIAGEYDVACSVSGKKGKLTVTGAMIAKIKDVHEVDIGTGYMNLCILR